MGFLNHLKGKKVKTEQAGRIDFPVFLGAPAAGMFISMSQIPDEVFSTGVLGACCGITPNEGAVYAPISGKISHIADTSHAVGIETDELELLIHVGVDTVDMNGDGFCVRVKPGQAVEKGELLLTMDLAKIHEAGHPSTVIMAVTNSDHFTVTEETDSKSVQSGDSILKVSR